MARSALGVGVYGTKCTGSRCVWHVMHWEWVFMARKALGVGVYVT